jgi:adenylate cyclase
MIEKINNNIDSIFPKGYPIVFFNAHPDDESFLSAGLINKLSGIGRECILVYGAAAELNEQHKTRVRQEETVNACKILGASKIYYLNYCEPQYTDIDARPLIQQDIKVVSEHFITLIKENISTPLVLISYDKNGGYGNQDHKIIHSVGRTTQSMNPNEIPILFEVTLNREHVHSWLNEAKKRLPTSSLPLLSYWTKEFGLPASAITHCFKLNKEQVNTKLEALAAHPSQLRINEFPLSLSNVDFSNFFGAEWLKCVTYNPKEFFEIEKKYLLSKIPLDLSNFKSSEITQGYLIVRDDGYEERIRNKDGYFTYCQMIGNGLLRRGKEVEITKDEFDKLWPKTQNKRIYKTRYTIPYNEFAIELDVYRGNLYGLVTAEIEFQSERIANCFIPPEWLEQDVTTNLKYKNKNLAC